mgnify:CR=1 FL=1
MMNPVLSQRNIYPLKSASGISLDNAFMEQRGLAHDRRWMVVDDSGQFMTQRTCPSMALINTELVGQTLTLNAPRMSELSLPLFPTKGESQEVEIWGDRCEAWTANSPSGCGSVSICSKAVKLFLCLITAIVRWIRTMRLHKIRFRFQMVFLCC